MVELGNIVPVIRVQLIVQNVLYIVKMITSQIDVVHQVIVMGFTEADIVPEVVMNRNQILVITMLVLVVQMVAKAIIQIAQANAKPVVVLPILMDIL